MENDSAQDWADNVLGIPLLNAIVRALQNFVDADSDGPVPGEEHGGIPLKEEAEAAVALLLDLAGRPNALKFSQYDISYRAGARGVWALAISAIKKLMADTAWIKDWNEPEQKLLALTELLSELEFRTRSQTAQ